MAGDDMNMKRDALQTTGMIFDIKRGATGDGPGLRTLVFLKGCPLRCRWCANPESQETKPQIMYYPKLCAGCGKCLAACPAHAVRTDERYGLVTDPDACLACGVCESACLYGARKMMGREMSVTQVMEVVRRDSPFYANSGGGVTVSGGEPLMQPAFTSALLQTCKGEGIHTAIETCGHGGWRFLEALLPYVDLIFYDLKLLDPGEHEKATGKGNELILSNLQQLNQSYDGELVVRIPFIPGYNDGMKTQEEIYRYVSLHKRVKRIEIMPYHRLGAAKYEGLGQAYALAGIEPVNKKDLDYLIDLGERCSVTVQIDSR